MSEQSEQCPGLLTVVLDRHNETLLTALTDAEFTDRAAKLARAVQEVGSLTAKHTDMKAQMKADLTRAESERDLLAMVVSRKAENREAIVEVRANYQDGRAYCVRLDTGEIVRHRLLTDQEKQQPLNYDGEPS